MTKLFDDQIRSLAASYRQHVQAFREYLETQHAFDMAHPEEFDGVFETLEGWAQELDQCVGVDEHVSSRDESL